MFKRLLVFALALVSSAPILGQRNVNAAEQLVGSLNLMPAGSALLVIGDSIPTGAYTVTGGDYPTQLMSQAGFAGRVTLYKDTVAGTTLAASSVPLPDMTTRYSTNNDGAKCRTATSLKPVYFLLDGGTNSVAANVSESDMYSQATALLAQAKADGCTPIAVTVRPRTGFTAAQELVREQYNVALRSTPSSTFALWDVENLLGNPNDTNYYADGTHPTQLGHYRMTAALARFLLGFADSAPLPFASTPNIVADTINYGILATMYTDVIHCIPGMGLSVKLDSASREGQRVRIIEDGSPCQPYMQDGINTVGGNSLTSGVSYGSYLGSKGDWIELTFHRIAGSSSGDWIVTGEGYPHSITTLTAQAVPNNGYNAHDIDCAGYGYYQNNAPTRVGDEITVMNSSATACNVNLTGAINGGSGTLTLAQWQVYHLKWLGSTYIILSHN